MAKKQSKSAGTKADKPRPRPDAKSGSRMSGYTLNPPQKK
jgi:hypothetical protein